MTADHPRPAQRVVRTVYEVCVLQALRDRLRCKEIWVVGADKWRNPDEDLPPTSTSGAPSTTRELDLPAEAATFIGTLREEMRAELAGSGCRAARLTWL